MSIALIYSSITGNTRRVAWAVILFGNHGAKPDLVHGCQELHNAQIAIRGMLARLSDTPAT
jgi:hypothetical protein